MRRCFFGAIALLFAACSGFQPVGDGDGGSDGAANSDGGGASDFAGIDFGPNTACRMVVLDCLDPTPANVIEVPTESTAADAFMNAKANDIIQIRGLSVGAGFRVPPLATLHGCAGAKIVGDLGFAGSGGVVEGFEVQASVIANQTGSYVVRYNKFTGAATTAGVSARSIDALVSAQVTMIVDSNWFESRMTGVEGATQYDTMTHEVTLTVQNSIFTGVMQPVVVDEAGLVGKITAVIEQNTFYQFDKAVQLYDIAAGSAIVSGGLFASGTNAVSANSPYEVRYSLTDSVTTPAPQAPTTGAFISGAAGFVDAANGDFRLGISSAAIDVIPSGTTVPGADYFGCPRPAALLGGPPKADIGAIEAQP